MLVGIKPFYGENAYVMKYPCLADGTAKATTLGVIISSAGGYGTHDPPTWQGKRPNADPQAVNMLTPAYLLIGTVKPIVIRKMDSWNRRDGVTIIVGSESPYTAEGGLTMYLRHTIQNRPEPIAKGKMPGEPMSEPGVCGFKPPPDK